MTSAPPVTLTTHGPRLLALLWLALFLPVYLTTYGAWHLLFLCNTGILLTAIGILVDSRLLVSSQLLAAPALSGGWLLDVIWHLTTGRPLHGGSAYMWDDTLPLAARVLSLYHLFWPMIVVAWVARRGYDRRAFPLQCAIAAAVFAVALWVAPAAENLNYVFHDPHRDVSHLVPERRALIQLIGLAAVAYWPLHQLAILLFRPEGRWHGLATLRQILRHDVATAMTSLRSTSRGTEAS